MEIEVQKEDSKLTDLIDKAKESEERGQSSFMNPGDKPKAKRGRKPKPKEAPGTKAESGAKSEQDRTSSKIDTKFFCLPITGAMSSVAVGYTKDPRAAMTQSEAMSMAEAMGLVLDKYLPDLLSNYGPEFMLCTALSQWGIRLMAIKKLQAEAAKNRQESPLKEARPVDEVKNNLDREPTPVP